MRRPATRWPTTPPGDQPRARVWEVPEPCPVDGDQPVVVDLFTREQSSDDLDALLEPSDPDALRGQPSPVMCSLMASPLPKATQNRPGNIDPSVAMACARTAGWYR